MSLIPHFYCHQSHPPTHLINQHFGHGLDIDDIFEPWPVVPSHYYRPWRSMAKAAARLEAGSKIVSDKDKFQVCLDVQQFAPEEITVKTVGNQIVVEGKHEEKQDEHGHISRHFVRKYQLPKDHLAEDVSSSLSSDGILSITAPRHQEAIKDGERIVPIVPTGPVHKTIKEKPKENNTMEH